MTEKIEKLALTSRLVLLVLQLLANLLLEDHKPDVFRSPSADATALHDNWLERLIVHSLGGLRHWDGEYYLHIAEHLYSYEQTLAFFPLYPLLVRMGAKALSWLHLGLSMRSSALLMAVLINIYFFCKAANLLYLLTQRIFNDVNKSWFAALLFCCNPASIFFSAAYSESLYCCCAFYLMHLCVGNMPVLRSCLALALSVATRSNGFINLGFPLYFLARNWLLKTGNRLWLALKVLLSIAAGMLPLTLFSYYAFGLFCSNGKQRVDANTPTTTAAHSAAIISYARERNYVLAAQNDVNATPWCHYKLPFPYAYIQSHYWQVGLLRYFQFKQLPNFLLAAPILGFLYWHLYQYLRQLLCMWQHLHALKMVIKDYKSLPFALHALFLTVFCTLFVHIQVSTRLLCSSTPCLYWFAADYFPKSLEQVRLRSKPGLILCWFTSYTLIGSVLFANNLPWT